MKVLMVSPSYGLNIGGAEIQLSKIQKRLDNSIETKIISKKSTKCSNTLYPFNYIFKLILYLFRNKIDIIHIHTFSSPAWVISILNIFINKPILVKITLSGNNSRLEKIKKNYIYKIFFHLCFYSKKIYFISVNKNIQKDLVGIGIKKNNLIKIPNGIEIKKFNISKKQVDVVFFGRLIKRKNVIEILNTLKKNALKHISFKIYGEGPERNEIIKFKNKNKLKNVSIKNFLNNKKMLKTIKTSKFTINASNAEGLSNAILESLSVGVPVICRNISQNKELVKNGFNGYIFKNDNELEKVFKKINNLSNYKKISNNAYRTAKKYDIEAVTNSYINKYKKLIN